MFVRVKNSHGYKYLQIVESKREGKKVKQRVLATLGQLDALGPLNLEVLLPALCGAVASGI